jgi:hypothetical protein
MKADVTVYRLPEGKINPSPFSEGRRNCLQTTGWENKAIPFFVPTKEKILGKRIEIKKIVSILKGMVFKINYFL